MEKPSILRDVSEPPDMESKLELEHYGHVRIQGFHVGPGMPGSGSGCGSISL